MIADPDRYVDAFLDAGADLVSIHQEAAAHLHRTLSRIRARGALAGVAINPATPVTAIAEALADADYVLVMSVNPGFGGQKFIPAAVGKTRRLRAMILESGLGARIEVDGGIGPGNAGELAEAGADWLVAGSAIYGGGDGQAGPRERTRALGAILGEAKP
jgi:ribulose-phosphate 3-epimerase